MDKCYVCGKDAECSGQLGYLCMDRNCENTDSTAAHMKYLIEEEREDPYDVCDSYYRRILRIDRK